MMRVFSNLRRPMARLVLAWIGDALAALSLFVLLYLALLAGAVLQ